MSPAEWRHRYIERMMERGLELWMAEMNFEAGVDDHDYDFDPAHAADEELSYWDDDGDEEEA